MNIQPKIIFNDEDIRTALIIYYIDRSGSVSPHQKVSYSASYQLVKTLAEKNEIATDVQYALQIGFFNEKLSWLNEEPLLAEDVLDLLSEEHFRAHGSTNISNVKKDISDRFHTNSEFIKNVQKCGVKPVIILETDYESNCDLEREKEYVAKIKNNRLIRDYAKLLCVYIGKESRKAAVEDLFGPDNVIALEEGMDLSKHLAATLINSTMNLIDGTNITAGEQTAHETAEAEKTRSKAASDALDTMSYDDAKAYMSNLFGRNATT